MSLLAGGPFTGEGSMSNAMQNMVATALSESVRIKEEFTKRNTSSLIRVAELLATRFRNGRKLMICGNGGSAADAQHLAAEFVNRFQLERRPLPALALTTDTSIITSVANDYAYDQVFSKQIKALGIEGDILLALSTSGKSASVLAAIRAARERGLYTVGLMGGGGGDMVKSVDLALVVDSENTARIQEAHLLAGHLICELVDYILFRKQSSQ